jgi:hypothetical protein
MSVIERGINRCIVCGSTAELTPQTIKHEKGGPNQEVTVETAYTCLTCEEAGQDFFDGFDPAPF